MWMFPKIAGKSPKWMVKIMENYFLMDDLGGKPTIFGNIHLKFGVMFFAEKNDGTNERQKW